MFSIRPIYLLLLNGAHCLFIDTVILTLVCNGLSSSLVYGEMRFTILTNKHKALQNTMFLRERMKTATNEQRKTRY